MQNKLNFHILVNETAGNGHAEKILDQTVIELVQADLDFNVQKSNYAGEFIKLAQAYADQEHTASEILLVIGGDGSLNEVLNGIKRSKHPDTPLAYLPAGTGNDFARAAKLTSKPKELIKRLQANPVPVTVDCGAFDLVGYQNQTCYFANSFGIGFDASVNHISNNSQFKKLLNKINEGNLVYAIHILNAVLVQNTFKIEVEVDGKKQCFDNTYIVTTTNHAYFGGGIPLLPSANIYSHKLDIVIIEKDTLPKLIWLLIKLLKDGSHIYDPQFHYIEADKIKLITKNNEFGQVDGEELAQQQFNLEFSIAQFNLLK